MTKKKSAREEQLRAQRNKRRYPFESSTKLIELVDKKHYGDIVKLTERLRPFLLAGKGAFYADEAVFRLRQAGVSTSVCL